jgi:hypothetical protein
MELIKSIELDDTLNRFDFFVKNYVEAIDNLLDLSIRNNLLPFKYKLGIPYIREYIKTNRILLLEHGIIYLLPNKYHILNFSIDSLDELDDDSDDNISRKECNDNISLLKNKFKKELENFEGNEIITLIIDIKNKSKKLDKENIELIRNYIKIMIIILEEIKKLF